MSRDNSTGFESGQGPQVGALSSKKRKLPYTKKVDLTKSAPFHHFVNGSKARQAESKKNFTPNQIQTSTTKSRTNIQKRNYPAEQSSHDRMHINIDAFEPEEIERTNHQERQIVLNQGWKSMVEDAYTFHINNLVPEKACHDCQELFTPEFPVYKCSDCSPGLYFCHSCSDKRHSAPNAYWHNINIWNGGFWQKSTQSRKDIHVPCRQNHQCIEVFQDVTVIDHKGCPHDVKIWHCTSITLLNGMISLRLWPASPSSPKTAVSMDLMENLRVMFYDQQVSLYGYCEALKFQVDDVFGLLPVKSDLHRNITTSMFLSYCQHIFNLNDASRLDPVLNNGFKCPACERQPTQFICMDGCMGLVHLSSADFSAGEPFHSESGIWIPNDRMKALSGLPTRSGKSSFGNDCSHFQAADIMRNKNKTGKLSSQGVFSACCPHGIPLHLLDIKKGESFDHAVICLKEILQNASKETTKFNVFYDIGCKLDKYCEKINSELGEEIRCKCEFCVNVFHSYGHVPSCQKAYNPRGREGWGLCDGEQNERFWGFFRFYCIVTKIMRPENRIDVFINGCLHWITKKNLRLGSHLLKKMNETKALVPAAGAKLSPSQTVSTLPEFLRTTPKRTLTPKEKVTQLAVQLQFERNALGKLQLDDPTSIKQAGVVARMEREVCILKKKENILPFTDLNSLKNAINQHRANLLWTIKKNQDLKAYCSSIFQRHSSGGQMISGKTSTKIKHLAKEINDDIQSYNKFSQVPSLHGFPQKVDLALIHSFGVDLTMPSKQDRVSEELKILNSQIEGAITFYRDEVYLLKCLADKENDPNMAAFARSMQFKTELKLFGLHQTINVNPNSKSDSFSTNNGLFCPLIVEFGLPPHFSFRGHEEPTDYITADYTSDDGEDVISSDEEG